MESRDIKEIMGLIDLDTDMLGYLQAAGYSEAELHALRAWHYRRVFHADSPTRAQALAWFFEALPVRTEAEFIGYWQALWDSGLTGPLIARMLNRDPID